MVQGEIASIPGHQVAPGPKRVPAGDIPNHALEQGIAKAQHLQMSTLDMGSLSW